MTRIQVATWVSGLVGAAITLGAGSARAQGIADVISGVYASPKVVTVTRIKAHKPRKAKRSTARRHTRHPATRVATYALRYEETPRPVCLPTIRAKGSQWVTEEGAAGSAKKDWAEEVRAEFGEKFMDLAFATDYAQRCWRSSVGEALGQTLHRCEVHARPCLPAFQEGRP